MDSYPGSKQLLTLLLEGFMLAMSLNSAASSCLLKKRGTDATGRNVKHCAVMHLAYL